MAMASDGDTTTSTPVWYTSLRRKAIQQHPTDNTLCTHEGELQIKTTGQTRMGAETGEPSSQGTRAIERPHHH